MRVSENYNSKIRMAHTIPRIYLFILLPFLVFLTYSNTLHSPFIFDDINAVQDNLHLRLTHITPQTLFEAAFSGTLPTRPVANLSFALDYYFHQGHNLISLHLTNIAIHYINAALLYVFILLTLKTPAIRNQYKDIHLHWVPLLTSLLWAVHPLHTQSVTYIVQRMNSLAVLFYLLAFIFYITARNTDKNKYSLLLALASIIAGALAIGTKEISITLPAFILLYEFFFFQNLDRGWLRQQRFLFIVLFIGGVAVFFIKFGLLFWETIPASYARRDFTLTERLLTEPRVIFFYLSLLFFPLPARLNLEHDFQISQSLTDPLLTLPVIVLLFLLPLLAVLIARKERLAAFTIFWFLGNLALESSFIPLEIIFEHRTYLPSMMVILLMVIILFRLVQFRTLLPVILVLAGLLAIGTFQRNKVWKDELSILLDCVEKSPTKARPHYNLGIVYSEQGESSKAIEHYEKARQVLRSASINTNLGIELYRIGSIDGAIASYRHALEIEPNFPMAHYHLGVALAATKDRDNALKHLYASLDNFNDKSMSYIKIGEVHLAFREPQAALQAYGQALKTNPLNPTLLNNTGIAFLMLGDSVNARRYIEKAIQIAPNYSDAINNLKLLDKKSSQVELPVPR